MPLVTVRLFRKLYKKISVNSSAINSNFFHVNVFSIEIVFTSMDFLNYWDLLYELRNIFLSMPRIICIPFPKNHKTVKHSVCFAKKNTAKEKNTA